MKYSDIPQHTRQPNYVINIPWDMLQEKIARYVSEFKGDIDPPFQRGHVWTTEQQSAYVEYKLKGGIGSNLILWNCPGWMADFRGPMQLVDGKQRIQAVLNFLENKIPVFGQYYLKHFEGRLPWSLDFVFGVNNLPSQAAVLKWYLELNAGGTPHTEAELEKVRNMIRRRTK